MRLLHSILRFKQRAVKMGLLLLLVSAVFVTVSGQSASFGGCPNAKPVTHLDLSKYLGVWHEVYRINNIFETEQKCVTANYTLKANGHVQVLNRGVTEGKPVKAIGDAIIPDMTKPAQLSVKFNEGAPYAPYWVLETDYNTYSVVFSCESLGGLAHVEFVWILSRQSTISESVRQNAFKVLQKNGVGTQSIKKTDNTNCPN